MSRMKRSVAVIGVGALVASGLALVVGQTSAQAATTVSPLRYQCQTVIPGTPPSIFTSSATAVYSVSLSAPGKVAPNTSIPVTASYSPALNNGPVPQLGLVVAQRVNVSVSKNLGPATIVAGPQGATSGAPQNIAASTALPNPAPGIVSVPAPGSVNGDSFKIRPQNFYQDLLAGTAFGSPVAGGQTECRDDLGTSQPTDPNPGDTQDGTYNDLTVLVADSPTANITAVATQGTSTQVARSGNAITVSGANWGDSNGQTITVQLCDATGAACQGAGASPLPLTAATTASVTGGVLTANVVTRATAGTGAKTIKFVSGGPVADEALTAQITLLGNRAISVSPSQGSTGTVVTGTLSNFDAQAPAAVFASNSFGVVAAGAAGCSPTCDIAIPGGSNGDQSAATVATSNTGTATNTVTITNSGVKAIGGYQGALPVPASFGAGAAVTVYATGAAASAFAGNFTFGVNSCTAAPSCATIQFLSAQVDPGQLTLSQSDANPADLGKVAFAARTLNGATQTTTASLDDLEVTDNRGTNAAWALSGSLTDFTVTGGTLANNGLIPSTNLAWAPTCAVKAGTGTDPLVSGVSAAAGGSFVAGAAPAVPGVSGTTANASLCTKAAGQGGGTWTADAGLTLTLPPTIQTGNYKATLYLVLA